MSFCPSFSRIPSLPVFQPAASRSFADLVGVVRHDSGFVAVERSGVSQRARGREERRIQNGVDEFLAVDRGNDGLANSLISENAATDVGLEEESSHPGSAL